MKANELKRGLVIQVEGQNILLKDVQVQTAASRSGNTLYKVRGQNIVTRQKFEQAYKGDDNVTLVEFVKRPVQLLYRDADGCTFMDNESYEQYLLSEEVISDDLSYIAEGLEGIHALIADEVLLGIELPPTVVLEIVDCAPGIKGASASARTKPATLSTGLVVQVPEYMERGERVKVNTASGEYMSRAG